MRCFPLAAFKAFLCIVFRSLIITYVGVEFFGFILFEVPCVVESVGLYLSPDLGFFHSFFFSFKSLYSFSFPGTMMTLMLDSFRILSVPKALFFIKMFFFLFAVQTGFLWICLQVHWFSPLLFPLCFWTHSVSFLKLLIVFFSYQVSIFFLYFLSYIYSRDYLSIHCKRFCPYIIETFYDSCLKIFVR